MRGTVRKKLAQVCVAAMTQKEIVPTRDFYGRVVRAVYARNNRGTIVLDPKCFKRHMQTAKRAYKACALDVSSIDTHGRDITSSTA